MRDSAATMKSIPVLLVPVLFSGCISSIDLPNAPVPSFKYAGKTCEELQVELRQNNPVALARMRRDRLKRIRKELRASGKTPKELRKLMPKYGALFDEGLTRAETEQRIAEGFEPEPNRGPLCSGWNRLACAMIPMSGLVDIGHRSKWKRSLYAGNRTAINERMRIQGCNDTSRSSRTSAVSRAYGASEAPFARRP